VVRIAKDAIWLVVALNIHHPDFAVTFEQVRTSNDHPDFVVYSSNSRADVADNGATIELKKGVEFSGFVTDGDNNPIEGATVATDWRSSATDANGRFALRMVERSTDRSVDLFVRHSFSRIFKVAQSELKDGSANLKFLEPAKIKGKVVSAHSGQPIEGMYIRVDPEESNGMTRTRNSDVNGCFEESIESGKIKMTLRSHDTRFFAEKASGEGWKLLARHQSGGGEMFGAFEVEAGETKENTIRVPVRNAIRARAIDLNGNPVEGALVGFPSLGGGTVGFIKTDAKGMVGIDPPDLLHKTRLLVARFEREGEVFFAESDTRENVELEIIDLTLRPSITISGKVSVDEKPILDATVFVRRRNDGKPAYVVGSTMTNEQGEYSVQIPRGETKGLLPDYQVEVASEMIPNSKASLRVNKDKLVDGELKSDVNLIQGMGKIAGTVVNSKDEPVANAMVDVQHLMMRQPKRKELLPSQMFDSMMHYTDDKGRFEISGLPEGFEAIVAASIPNNAMRGASLISVGNLTTKIWLPTEWSQRLIFSLSS